MKKASSQISLHLWSHMWTRYSPTAFWFATLKALTTKGLTISFLKLKTERNIILTCKISQQKWTECFSTSVIIVKVYNKSYSYYRNPSFLHFVFYEIYLTYLFNLYYFFEDMALADFEDPTLSFQFFNSFIKLFLPLSLSDVSMFPTDAQMKHHQQFKLTEKWQESIYYLYYCTKKYLKLFIIQVADVDLREKS
jgi:hypothetical protein